MFCLAGFLYLGLRFIIMCTRQPSLFRPRLLPSVRRTAQRSQRFLSTFIQLLKSLYRTKSSTVSLLQTSQISSPLAPTALRHRGTEVDKEQHSCMETWRYGCWFSRDCLCNCRWKKNAPFLCHQGYSCFSVGNCLILDSLLLTDVECRVANPFAC